MSHFQRGTLVEMGCRTRRGGLGKMGGRVDRLREQSPIWSLIINMSITGMRRMTGIKAAIGSCRKHKAGNGGKGTPFSLLWGRRHRPGQDPAWAWRLTRFIRCAALRPPDLPIAASTSRLPHGKQEPHGELLLHLYHTQHHYVIELCDREASKVGTQLPASSKPRHPPQMSDWYPMWVMW